MSMGKYKFPKLTPEVDHVYRSIIMKESEILKKKRLPNQMF